MANPADAPAHLEWWLRWVSRCRIPAFVKLAKTVRKNRECILAAVELGLSNSKLGDLTHQPPRLRTPFDRSCHRHNLPLLWRAHDRATNGESRPMIGNDPHKLEENPKF
ncbi:MAG: transposase [Ferrimicrobium sp.]